MIYEDKNYLIIDEDFFNEVLDESIKNEFYYYHYILVKYIDGCNNVNTLKIDQVKDLYKLKNKIILYKYYIKKIHFYTESGNYLYMHGEPYNIYNLGCFYIGGDIPTSKKEKPIIEKMFDEYNKNYDNMTLPFTDEEFLSLNKSQINF